MTNHAEACPSQDSPLVTRHSSLSLVVSFDTIVQPPYSITPEILKLVESIGVSLGEINGRYLTKPAPHLRKENRIRTIQASLAIEGNSLSLEQITAILSGKRVIGPQREIVEDRVQYFLSMKNEALSLQAKSFSRKDYMQVFKTLSTATASCDLYAAVKSRVLNRLGDGNQARYQSANK